MFNKNETILVKKYENRRMYSTFERRYVNLSEIEQWILKGHRVQVVDANTNDDLTSEILVQILLEKGRFQFIPVEILEQMIRLSDNAVHTLMAAYFDQSISLFRKLLDINPFLTKTSTKKENPK